MFSGIGWFFTDLKLTLYNYLAVFLYGPAALVSVIAMLVKRRIGWILALLTLAASSIYFAPAALGYLPPGFEVLKPHLFLLTGMVFSFVHLGSIYGLFHHLQLPCLSFLDLLVDALLCHGSQYHLVCILPC